MFKNLNYLIFATMLIACDSKSYEMPGNKMTSCDEYKRVAPNALYSAARAEISAGLCKNRLEIGTSLEKKYFSEIDRRGNIVVLNCVCETSGCLIGLFSKPLSKDKNPETYDFQAFIDKDGKCAEYSVDTVIND
ncbi:MAG TPA: hypothetical protein VIZ65_05445 [Cellvibrionaceae bacterium]